MNGYKTLKKEQSITSESMVGYLCKLHKQIYNRYRLSYVIYLRNIVERFYEKLDVNHMLI